MKTKKLIVIVFALVILSSLSSCTKKENENKSNANFENLSWNENTEEYNENRIQYSFKKSSDFSEKCSSGVVICPVHDVDPTPSLRSKKSA